MRIALIEPGSPVSGYFLYKRFPHLGTLFLGKILKNAGHDVKVFKENIARFYDERKDEFNPFIRKADAVGLTAVTTQAKRAYMLADTIKRKFPEKKIVLGGNHMSALPEEALEHADQVVVGEGENVVLDVFEGRLTDRIVHGTRVDINNVPAVDLSLIHGCKTDKEKLKIKYAPIMTSRGCPFNCTFCSVTRMFGHRVRVRDVNLVMEEILMRYLEGFRRVFFYDDNFTAHFEKSKILLERLVRADLELVWYAQCRIDIARDRELLELLKRSKCEKLFIGVESINPRALEDYNKRQTVEQIKQSISRIQEAGIEVHSMWVIGSDSDDESTIEETIRFSKSSGCRSTQFSILFPIPGTRLYSVMESEKRIFTKDWNYYDGTHSVMLVKHITPIGLQRKLIRGYKYFYSILTGHRWVISRIGLLLWRVGNSKYLKYLRSFTRRLIKAGLVENGKMKLDRISPQAFKTHKSKVIIQS